MNILMLRKKYLVSCGSICFALIIKRLFYSMYTSLFCIFGGDFVKEKSILASVGVDARWLRDKYQRKKYWKRDRENLEVIQVMVLWESVQRVKCCKRGGKRLWSSEEQEKVRPEFAYRSATS